MFLVVIGICLTFQSVFGAPFEKNNLLLKKRELEGLSLPLSDIISNVENSLIKEAFSAGSGQEFGKLRNGRDTESDNSQKTPKTQLSILTVKINPLKTNDSNRNSDDLAAPSELGTEKDIKNLKDSVKDNKVKLDSLANKQKNDSTDDKTFSLIKLNKDSTEILNNTKSETKEENIKNEKGKKIVNTVAEIEVNPVIFASRA